MRRRVGGIIISDERKTRNAPACRGMFGSKRVLSSVCALGSRSSVRPRSRLHRLEARSEATLVCTIGVSCLIRIDGVIERSNSQGMFDQRTSDRH
jgi:hypothetical protein